LARAREWVRLSVDDLSERTRIRPHVIEAIEVDDFSACGGDVYARGHLRALARALGIDADPLIADYDACYASAPVSARRVFEAELAGPGRALRPTSGGPRWSVLVAVVLVLVLMWALARLLVPPPADNGNGNGGADAGQRGAESSQSRSDTGDGTVLGADAAAERFEGMGQREPVSARLQISVADTTTEAVPVVVRAADGSIAFRGSVGPDEPRTVRVPGGEAIVRTPDAAAVQAKVDGRDVAVLDAPGPEVQTSLSP
jgi:cytoskeletal protein RodZ